MGVNDKNDLAMAEKEIQNELRSKHLTAGVTMVTPAVRCLDLNSFWISFSAIAKSFLSFTPITSVSAVCIQTAETEVMGVNDKNDLAMAEKEIQNELRSKHLTAGVTMRDPDTVYLSKDTKIGKDVTIHPFVIIGKNVVIGNNTEIHAFSHIEDCKIGKEVSIGPYARIRPGTKLNDNAKVGNFVEIKNSKIDKGSKVNHLSYIGDTEIGKKVNVGAGTITCNYDGASKFKTVIKDRAFIGSNSSLVAPLIVGKNAYIGSGSTITKHVVENSLAVERSSQKMVKNWSNKKGKK